MTDDARVKEIAREIDAAQLRWKHENGGDDVSCVDCPSEYIAGAILDAHGLNHQTGPSARDAALEEAAKWHDRQASNYVDAFNESGRSSYRSCEREHRQSAAALRAMKGGDGGER